MTVAVQCSAGTAALTRALPRSLGAAGRLFITVGVVLILIYGNLRGLREAGSYFAVPTYFYVSMLSAHDRLRVLQEDRRHPAPNPAAAAHLLVEGHLGHQGNGLLMGLAFISLLRAYANGGSSLTGLEAISNGVASFRRPESPNARKTLVTMSCILAFLLLGTTLLASWTHAIPYAAGSPTVVSQEVIDVFGARGFGHAIYFIVQFATMMILFTGGNTSFNGFPFLANYVATDKLPAAPVDQARPPPRLLQRHHRARRRGAHAHHRLQRRVNALVSLYAIGVFTGFTLAGAGMVARHLRENATGSGDAACS